MSKNIVPLSQGSDNLAGLLPGQVLLADGQRVETSSGEIISQGPDVADAQGAAAAPASDLIRLSKSRKRRLAPPSSNTGAQNTSIQLDWLSGTFPLTVTLEEALGFLGEDFAFNGVHYEATWVPLKCGAMGYKSAVACGDLKVFHDGTDKMGVHFVFSAKAVKQFMASSNIHTETDLRAWLARAVGRGIVFARCDFAFDDRSADEPLLDLQVVLQAVKDRSAVSKFKSIEERRKWDLGQLSKTKRPGPETMREAVKQEPALLSDVLYFGSIMSEMCVCMYDKAKEQLLGEGERWIRCELRAKKRKAHALVRAVIKHGVSVVAGVLWSYLDFKEPGADSNASRRGTVSWWERFLDVCEACSLVIDKPERSVQRVREWLLNQVAPMLAVVWEAGSRESFVRHMVAEGKSRWLPGGVHERLVAAAKAVPA